MSSFDLPPVLGFGPGALSREQAPLPRSPIAGAEQEPAGGAVSSSSFEGALTKSLAGVQSLQDDTRAKTRGLVLGEDVELHDVMLAANKSEVAFNLLLEVRNKLIDAWEKLSRSVT
jgi:flagellar hook-basal body complex protein FliE